MPKVDVIIHSAYNTPDDSGIECKDISLAQQHFRDECDINFIMAKYETTGFIGDPLASPTVEPQYGDFSTVHDFLTAQTILAHSMQAFEALPALVRKRFNNDPAEMLDFIGKEENKDEAIRLGLCNPSEKPSSSTGGVVPPVASSSVGE